MQLNAHQKLFKFYWSMCFLLCFPNKLFLNMNRKKATMKAKPILFIISKKASFHIFPRATLMKVIANTDITTHMPKIVLFLNEPNGPPVPLL